MYKSYYLKILYTLVFMSCQLLLAQYKGHDFVSKYYNLKSKDKGNPLVFCDQLINSNNYEKKAFGYAGKGYIYCLRADYKNANELFNKSTFLLDKYDTLIDREVKGNILYLMAEANNEKHKFDKALSLLSLALNTCDSQCSFILENKLRSAQGRIYSMSSNKLKALEINRISLKRLKEQPNFSTNYELKKQYLKELAKASSRYINSCFIEKKKNHLDSTKKYTSLAKKFAIEYDIHIYDDFIEVYFADIEFYQDKFDTAIIYYKNALELFLKNNNKKRITQMHFQIAACNYYLNNLDEAEASFKNQIEQDVWSQYPLLKNKALCYDYLAKIYKQKGDLPKMITNLEAYITNSDTFSNKKNSSDLSVNNKMHIEERKLEVKKLKKEYQNQVQQKRLYSYVSIALVITILLLMAYFIYKNNKTKQNISKLNERILWLQQGISKEAIVSKSSSLTDENALKLIEKLKNLEKEALFTDSGYSLNMVAKKLNTNSSYLSKTVNNYMNISFVEYSNRLKINSIVQRLNNQKNLKNYTIEALAREAGYKSVNSFNSNFKKLLKVTPSQYLANLENN
ncbi:hypothetical protein THALO_440005 [Tenacibaculum halocynthiae]